MFENTSRLIDVALVIVAAEVLVLFLFGRRLKMKPADVVGQLLAGVLLMVAVRCAVAGADGRWTLLFLGASFPAHLFDLARRRAGAISQASPPEPRPPRAGQS